MDIQVLQLLEGARQARGLTVIIDVFRAFTVEAYYMHRGADRVIPIGDIQEAFRLKAEHPDYILSGERGGAIVDGFQFGNSPSAICDLDFTGKTIVHTTSAGTQGIANASAADEILTGSLVNAGAIAQYIRSRNPDTVSLVCMGLEAREETQEDTLCARYIESLLTGIPLPNLSEQIADLKNTSGAKFFNPALEQIFPLRDFELCTRLDCFPFVLRLNQSAPVAYIEKISI